MTIASIVSSHFKQAFSAVSHSDQVLAFFQAAGFDALTDVLSFQPSFASGAPAAAELQALHDSLVKVGKLNGTKWPASSTSTQRILRTLVSTMSSIKPVEASAIAAWAAANTAGSTGVAAVTAAAGATAANTTAADKKRGSELYAVAERAHGKEYLASEMIKHEVIGKLHAGFVQGQPTGFAVSEYGLNLKVRSAKTESYTMMGESYIRQDAADKPIDVKTWDEMHLQMLRRAEAKSVAGCFDVKAAATAASLPLPSGDKAWEGSTLRWVEAPASGLVAKEMLCFATPAGQEVQVAAMVELHRTQPHLSIVQLLAIDAKVEKRINDLILKGYIGDAAVQKACVKSPELYSATTITPAELADAGGTPAAWPASAPAAADGTPGTDKGRKGKARTPVEETAALKRQIEQDKRQIENLKRGKGGGKNGWSSGPPQWQPSQQYHGWGNQPQGKGGGPPQGSFNVPCAPHLCKDFNFKVNGCERGNACKLKHECAVCGGKHPFRGNH